MAEVMNDALAVKLLVKGPKFENNNRVAKMYVRHATDS